MSSIPRICVFYATEEGQTEKIATHIADSLKKHDFEVQIENLKKLSCDFDINCFQGIVIGGSVHFRAYDSHVYDFVLKHISELNSRPSAFFSVSGAAIDSEENAYQTYIEPFEKSNHWKPDLAVVFAGAIKYSKYGWFKKQLMRLIASTMKINDKPIDTSKDYEFTNWESVNHFAEDFAKIVHSKLSDHEIFDSP